MSIAERSCLDVDHALMMMVMVVMITAGKRGLEAGETSRKEGTNRRHQKHGSRRRQLRQLSQNLAIRGVMTTEKIGNNALTPLSDGIELSRTCSVLLWYCIECVLIVGK